MTSIRSILFCALVCFGLMPCLGAERSADSPGIPNFQDLYNLIQTNLPGLSEADLNRAAVSGLLSQLQNRVCLMTNAPTDSRRAKGLPLDKTLVFDRAYAYLKIEDVRYGLAQSFARAFDQMSSSNKLRGLVMDLRFASGDDYDEAAAVCDLFFSSEQPLLKWAGQSSHSTVKTNSVALPVMMLVNHRTSGAAEALAAVLRTADVGLIIGSPTAGNAQVFKEYALGNDQWIRIASGTVEVGQGIPLSAEGLTPDIRVPVSEDAERGFLADPYRVSTPQSRRMVAVDPSADSTGEIAADASRRRLTESILIHENLEGDEPDHPDLLAPLDESPPPVVQDPSLARALDVLKGLALVRTRR